MHWLAERVSSAVAGKGQKGYKAALSPSQPASLRVVRRVFVPLLVVAAGLALVAIAWRTGASDDPDGPNAEPPAADRSAADGGSRRGESPAARAAAGPVADLDPATTIRGRVTDSGDAAIVGVRVTLHAPHPKHHVEGGVHLADFDRVLAETTTAWDGTFALPEGSAEERIVVAAKEGFVPAARRASPAEECALRLHPGQELTLRVEDLAGRAVAGATVYARGGTDPSACASPVGTSDTEGRVAVRFEAPSLVRGRLGLVVRAPGFAATDVGDLDSGDAEEERTVVLENESVIAGHVIDGAGAPVAGAVVQLGSSWDEEVGQGLTSRLVTGEDGAFRFDAVSPRLSRDVSAQHDGREVRMRSVFPGRTDIRLVLRREGTVRGTVVLEDGAPAAGGRIALGEGAVELGAEGDFETSVAPGPRRVRAWWPEGEATHVGSTQVDVPEGGTVEGLCIVLREERNGSRLRVNVVDADGRPVEEFGVTAFHGTHPIASESAKGPSATLALPVPAGTPVRVVVSPSRWDWHGTSCASAAAVTAAPDDTAPEPVALRFGPPGKLTIRLEDPHGAEVPLSRARIAFGDRDAPPPQGGAWPLHPARNIDVAVTVPGFARHRVRVEPPHADPLDLTIRLSRPARLAGRFVECDGRPATSGTRLSLEIPFEVGGCEYETTFVTDDGRFLERALPPGDATLSVGMPGDTFADDSCRLRRALRLEAGETLDLGTIVLPRIELVEGVVTDERGAGLGGAIVGFVDGPTQRVVPGTSSGPDGRFRAKLPLRDGVRFSVVRPGYGPALVPFDPAGPRPVRIVLRPGGRVRVRFDGEFSFVRFRTSPEEEWRFPLLAARPSPGDDDFTIDGLPAGEVELVANVLGVERTIRVTVVAGETVEARF